MLRVILTMLFCCCCFCASANVFEIDHGDNGIVYKVDQMGSKKKSRKPKMTPQEIRKLSHEQMEPFPHEVGIEKRIQI